MFPDDDFSFMSRDISSDGGQNQGNFESIISEHKSGTKKILEANFTDEDIFLTTNTKRPGRKKW